MGRIAFLFPGQGAQAPGMGLELYEASPAARAVMDRLEALRPGTLEQCFQGAMEALTQTQNAQPCLFAVDLMAAHAAREAGLQPDMCAGFSLGETAAAAFTGIMPLKRAFAFVLKRAEEMAFCTQKHPGFMAAVLRLSRERVEEVCRGFREVYPVNYNAPGQVAVAGAAGEREAFLKAVSEAGGRAVPLSVSGAFHCPLMTGAAHALREWLRKEPLAPPSLPLYANRTALPYGENAAELLSQQVDHPVLWEETIRNMAAQGADLFVEVGPGTVLSGLVQRILPGAAVLNVQDAGSLQKAVSGRES